MTPGTDLYGKRRRSLQQLEDQAGHRVDADVAAGDERDLPPQPREPDRLLSTLALLAQRVRALTAFGDQQRDHLKVRAVTDHDIGVADCAARGDRHQIERPRADAYQQEAARHQGRLCTPGNRHGGVRRLPLRHDQFATVTPEDRSGLADAWSTDVTCDLHRMASGCRSRRLAAQPASCRRSRPSSG